MSIILRTAARALVPIILVFSFFIMLRGHNEPGGGFIGGMVAGGAFALYLLAYGIETARKALPVPAAVLVAGGFLVALGSGLIGLILDGAYLTGVWWEPHLPILGTFAFGTPLIFDIGVYLLVTGMTITILFHLAEET